MSRQINDTVSQFEESVFSTMSRLAQKNSAINLSQGFPDFQGPEWIRSKAAQLITDLEQDHNQYAPAAGIPQLRQAVSRMMEEEHQLKYAPDDQITITNGATEALFLSCQALFNPGDEILIFEPFYDSYLASIKLAGLIPKVVTLHAPEFSFDPDEVKKLIGPKTKGLFWNDPHNPTGRVFSSKERKDLADIICEHDLLAICDHVYEFLSYEPHQFKPLAAFNELQERVVYISSAGKTFGLTGWKVGWALTTPQMTQALQKVHQFNTFCVAHPLQKAIAYALENRHEYLKDFREDYRQKRDFFTTGLEQLGLRPHWAQGTYFTLCPIPRTSRDDIQFCEELIQKYKVSAIPPSAFYANSEDGKKYIRFCFAKKRETLQRALESLKGLDQTSVQ